jgi:glycosyltransferase involved in cell wall biosynthesis
VRVTRFRYAPERWERLAYGYGMLPNVSRAPLLLLLVPGFLLAQLWATLRLLRRRRFDCLNAHWIFPQGLVGVAARWFTPGLRLVVTVHGGDISALGSRRALRPMLRWVLGRAALTLPVSSVTEQAVRAVCPEAPTERISMGVDATRFRAASGSSALRERFADGAGPLLLFCGRITQKKGLRHLIAALPAVRMESPAARLLVVGDGEERRALEELAASLGLGGAVAFAGAVPNDQLPEYYAAADLCVCPSIVDARGDTEGLPVVLLEAAATGLALVASRVGGIPDLVRDGETGLLVPPEDPEALGKAILRLLGDEPLRRRLGENARALVLATFTWEQVAARYARALLVPGGPDKQASGVTIPPGKH